MSLQQRWLIVISFLACFATMATSQKHIGRGPCPTNSSIIGYTNTTLLNLDIKVDMEHIDDGGPLKPLYRYILCPETTFRIAKHFGQLEEVGESYITPGLANSVFQCGDAGNSSGNCLISGGDFHFLFADGVMAEKTFFLGLKFEGVDVSSIYGLGHPESRLIFRDCHWKANTGQATIYLVTPKKDDNNRALSSRKEPRELQDITTTSMRALFKSCTFNNNDDVMSVIYNIGGSVELIETTFTNNDVARGAVVSVRKEGHLFVHDQSTFTNNFSRLGPIFVDKTSFLQLSRDNFGVQNNGEYCDAILIEADDDECFNRNICTGNCCAFGDETCDLHIKENNPPTRSPIQFPPKVTRVPTTEPTKAPVKSPTKAPVKAPTRAPTKAPVKAPVPTPVPERPSPAEPNAKPDSSSSTASVQAGSSASGGCGTFCGAFITLVAVIGIVIIVALVIVIRSRKRGKEKSFIPSSGNDGSAFPVSSDPVQEIS